MWPLQTTPTSWADRAGEEDQGAVAMTTVDQNGRLGEQAERERERERFCKRSLDICCPYALLQT